MCTPFRLVVIGYLNLMRACVSPNEADAVLVVNSDAVLADALAYKRFETRAG
jgi:hypothetical protein